MPLNENRGATLIEVLIATCLAIGVIVMMSLIFPTVSKNVSQNRKRALAVSIASSQIATFQSKPYGYLDPTDDAFFGAGNPTCNCATLDYSVLPSTNTDTAGTTFQLRSCVNYVTNGPGNTWTSQCNAAGDTGYKNIMVRVSWKNGTSTDSVSQEASLSRY